MASGVQPGHPAANAEDRRVREEIEEEVQVQREIKEEQDRLAFGKPTAELEWDGIRKLDYPPPRWWVLTFWGSFLFAILWWILYPSWPGTRSYFPGLLGYDQRVEVEKQLSAAEEARARFVQAIEAAPLEQVQADPQLLEYAVNAGRVVFNNNCAQCHGLGGAGQGFFPSLADDDWLWGGSPDEIAYTITHGVRSGTDEARFSEMPRFGVDQILTREQIDDVTEYVLSLSGQASPEAGEAVERGATVYTENCAACHGEGGEGDPAQGAPRLNDAIWLYGGEKTHVVAQISNPRHGVMPAFGARLDPATIKMLVAYVHGLGGGE